jgi:polysaccharide biosynthesis transport protein
MEVLMQLMDRTRRTADPMPSEPDVKIEPQDAKLTMVPELHFSQLMGVLRRRRKLILTIAAFGTILAGVTGLLISPKYTATAQIAVEPPAGALLSPETVQQIIDTHVSMLTSANHLQRVIASLRKEAELRRETAENGPETAASGNGVAGGVQAPSANAAQPAAAAEASKIDAAPLSLKELYRRINVWKEPFIRKRANGAELTFDELDRNLKVMQERRSRVITISFQWRSPEKAAAIANRIVGLYVESQTEQQHVYNIREMARLETRLAAVRSDIERASAALQAPTQRPLGASQSFSGQGQDTGADTREVERWASSSRHLYANLLQRQKELREQQEQIKPDASIVSLASPPRRPSSPNPILFMVPALIASLICGSLLATALERLDRGVRREREISDLFGISCIGLVPQIPRRCLVRLRQYLLAQPFSPYAEAIRSAVAMLRLTDPSHPAKVVLISSSIPGEGKTALAQSLAAYVGALGRRVLLIDLDFRRDSRPGERGTIDRSLQSRSPAESIRHVAEAGYDCLPLRGHCRDPLLLFASEQIQGLIRQLSERYDYLIIDGPPVLGSVEARLLPSIAHRLVLVVKWRSTRREVIENALNLLRDCGGLDRDRSDPAMAILTQVDLKRHARYRYGDVGEFLAGDRRHLSRSFGPRLETATTGPTADGHESHHATPSPLLHRTILTPERQPQKLKTEQPPRPKGTESEAGCSA